MPNPKQNTPPPPPCKHHGTMLPCAYCAHERGRGEARLIEQLSRMTPPSIHDNPEEDESSLQGFAAMIRAARTAVHARARRRSFSLTLTRADVVALCDVYERARDDFENYYDSPGFALDFPGAEGRAHARRTFARLSRVAFLLAGLPDGATAGPPSPEPKPAHRGSGFKVSR